MEQNALRLLIQSKLADGRLPQDSIPRVWGGVGAGETCDACEELISKMQFVMEGISTTGGKGIQFHVGCFHLWDEERWAWPNMSGEARILDGYIVREQNRAALQWRRSCASDDALKRRIDTQLSAAPLPTVMPAPKGSPSRAA